MAKFIRHEGCPKCGSSDSLAIYDDDGAHCFSASCNYHYNGLTGMTTQATKVTTVKPLNMFGVVAAIPHRRLSQDTCGRFGVTGVFFDETAAAGCYTGWVVGGGRWV